MSLKILSRALVLCILGFVFLSATLPVFNSAPVFESSPGTSISNNSDFLYQIQISDTDKDTYSVSLLTSPNWLTLTLNQGGEVSYLSLDGNENFAAAFTGKYGSAVDNDGHLYIADAATHNVYKIKPDGVMTLYAGNSSSGSADGQGSNAQFNGPIDLEVDSNGNLFVIDADRVIRKIDTDQNVTTFVGSNSSGNNNGNGNSATFTQLAGITIDRDNNIYVSDEMSQLIRKITPSADVTTLAGSTLGYTDGNGSSAQFNTPQGLATDGLGNIYVADLNNHRIRKISPTGIVTTLAGSGASQVVDGQGESASFEGPSDLEFDEVGNLYVANLNAMSTVRKIDANRNVSTILSSVGSQTAAIAITSSNIILPGILNQGRMTLLKAPRYELTGDPSGQVGNHNVTLRADDGNGGVTNQSFTITVTNEPPVFETTAATSVGNSNKYEYRPFVSDQDQNLISIAASTLPSWLGLTENNLVIEKSLLRNNLVYVDAKVDAAGNIYFIEDNTTSSAIKVLKTDGSVELLAGSLSANGFVDGIRGNARFNAPSALAIDNSGNVYVADHGNKALRKIDVNGNVTTVVGTGGTFDSQPLNNLRDVESDSDGKIYYSFENDNSAQVKQLSQGSIRLFANSPYQIKSMAIGKNGSIWAIAQAADDILFRIDNSSSEVLWNSHGENRGGNNGALSTATFNSPQNISIDQSGRAYITDANNNNVRMIDQSGQVSTVFDQSLSALAHGRNGVSVGVNGNSLLMMNSPGFLLSGNPSSQVGDHPVVLEANDGQGGTTTQSFTIKVTNNNPSFTSTPITEINNNLDYRYKIDWEDSDYNPVEITALTIPAWLSLDLNNGGEVSTLFNSSNVTGIDFNSSNGIAYDADGNLYTISDNRIIKITPEGEGSVLSGTGSSGYVDGPGNLAIFNNPNDLIVDSQGNVFVNDFNNTVIRKVAPDGQTSTFYDGSNVGLVYDLVIDKEDNIFLAENSKIQKLSPEGNLTLVGGSDAQGAVDGPALSASFNGIQGLLLDSLGNLFIAETGNNRIRKLNTQGQVSTVAGSVQGNLDGKASEARFDFPSSMVMDKFGNLYITDQNNSLIRRLDTEGNVTTYVGSTAGDKNGRGTEAQISVPTHLTMTSDHEMVFINNYSSEIKKVTLPQYLLSGDPSGQVGDHNVTLRAEDGQGGVTDQSFTINVTNQDPVFNSTPITEINNDEEYRYEIKTTDADLNPVEVAATTKPDWLAIENDPGRVTSTIIGQSDEGILITDLSGPNGMAYDSHGNLFIAEENNHRILKVDIDNNVSVLAGSTESGVIDGSRDNARFTNPKGLVIDSENNLFVYESGHSIRKISPEGQVTTFAGSSQAGFKDGIGSDAQFSFISGLEIDNNDNLIVIDLNNNRIRKIDPDATVSTIAGSGNFGSVDGEALSASFNYPKDLVVDSEGNLIIVDSDNHLIRKLENGIVKTIAGSSVGDEIGFSISNAKFNNPTAIALDPKGNMYISDTGNNKIKVIDSDGIVSLFIGSGESGYKDGVGSNAQFSRLKRIILNNDGDLIFSEANSRIRKVTTPDLILTGDPSNAVGNYNVELTATDGQGGSATQAFTISVNDVIAPVLTSASDITIDENTSGVFYTLTAEDAQAITYTVGIEADEALFSFDDATGELSFLSPPDFENPQDANSNNVYELAITATDGTNSTTFNLTVRIKNLQDEDVVFTSTPITEISNNTLYNLEVTAEDPDGEPVEITAPKLPDWLALELRQNAEVSTIVGSGIQGNGSIDLSSPHGMVYDSQGNLFIADGNSRIVVVPPDSEASVFAGTGAFGYVNGSAQQAVFNAPNDLVIDKEGNLFVSEQANNAIRKITPEGEVTTFVGSESGEGGYLDGTGTEARLSGPSGMAIDISDNIYFIDEYNSRIRKVTPQGEVSTIAGNGTQDYVDGNAMEASFNQPKDLLILPNGDIYISDSQNHVIRNLSNGQVTTIAGSLQGNQIGDALSEARFNFPEGIVNDSNGNLYITDRDNHTLKKIDRNNEVSVFAGSGSPGTSDGIGTNAEFSSPRNIIINPEGDLLIADTYSRIRKVTTPDLVLTGDPSNEIGNYDVELLAEDGQGGATTQAFTITVTNQAPVFVSEPVEQVIEGESYSYDVVVKDADDNDLEIVVNTKPEWLTLEQNPEGNTVTILSAGLGFRDGILNEAEFNGPSDIVYDPVMQVYYIADNGNHAIRKLDLDGNVTTFVGGEEGFEDGVGTNAKIKRPSRLALDLLGNLYLSEFENNAIRKITPDGTVTTIIGGGTSGFEDGPINVAKIDGPTGIAFDNDGVLHFADGNNRRIRKISNGVVTTIAGNGDSGEMYGEALSSSMNFPTSIRFLPNNDLLIGIGDVRSLVILLSDGIMSRFAGGGSTKDGPRLETFFDVVNAIEIDAIGNIYIADGTDLNIRKINRDGIVSTLSGIAEGFEDKDGVGEEASHLAVTGIGFGPEGFLHVVGNSSRKIKRVTPDQGFYTLSGIPSTSDIGDHNVVLQASDGQGGIATQSFTLEVSATPPEITSANTISVNENTTDVVYTIVATDPGTITYGLGSGNDESFFTVDTSTGQVSFNSAPDFENPLDADADNVYTIDVTAANADATATQKVLVTVNNVSDVAPQFDSSPITSVNDDASYRYEISVSDGDGEIPQVTASSLPDWLRLSSEVENNVSIVAGNISSTFTDGTGSSASFDDPNGIALDSDGNIYVADTRNHRIRRITPSGEVTTFAGNGRASFADGIGQQASFNRPIDLVFDSNGNLFVTDAGNNRIRKITPSGEVSTFAGNGISALVDGVGTDASFRQLRAIVIDANNNLYVACQSSVRRVSPDAEVTIYAGNESFGTNDGNGTQAGFGNIWGLAIDADGNLYTGEVFGAIIRKIDTNREVTFLAGSGTREYADGIGAAASFSQIENMTVGTDGNLYVSSDGVRRIDLSTQEVSRVLSGTTGNVDGTGLAALFGRPSGLVFDSNGNLFIADRNNSNIRVADSNLATTTLAGGATINYEDGPVATTNFKNVVDVAVAEDGTIFIASSGGPLRKVTPQGNVETVVGAAGSDVNTVGASYLHMLANGELLISFGNRVWKLLTDGRLVLFAGSEAGGNENGDRLSASFQRASGMTSDNEGNIYVMDQRNSSVRKIDQDGTVSTLAGSGAFEVVDGTGTNASFRLPIDITYASDGNLYVADAGGDAIRRVTKDGVVTTIASGRTSVSLPRGIIDGPDEALYVSVNGTDLVKRITYSGEITTVVGDGYRGYKPGLGTEASLNQPWGLTFDNNGSLLIADALNHMIRKFSFGGGIFLEGSAIGQSGSYEVVLVADDQNGGQSQQAFNIEVVDVTAPRFTSQNSIQVSENISESFYSIVVEETNSFSLTMSGGTDISLFSFDESSGELVFKSPPDFENPLDQDSDNIYLLAFTAEDASNNITQFELSVEVTDVDPEAILRVEGDLTIPPTALGFTSDFSITVHNDGDAELIISSIEYPEGYAGPNLPITIAQSSNASVTFQFNPTEQKTYDGDIVINSNGGRAVLSVSATGEIITSLEDSSFDKKLSIYPNPARERVVVHMPELKGKEMELSWFNSQGVEIGSVFTNNDSYTINLSNLPDGLMLIKISIEDEVVFRKVMIKR